MFFRRGWCKAATISAQSAASFADYYGSNVNNTLIYNGRKLSIAPSKEVLIAKMLGCLQSSLSKFVYVLDSIAKAKEAAN